MDLFKEIEDLSDLFLLEKNTKLETAVEGYEDLQSRYSSLHDDYAKEMENSKKVGKCLVKCLKFYSKLCKKYEAQQKVITRLEETVKEKMISLEEAQRNEEKMKGLIQVYRSERTFYVGQTISDLRKDKEILLDICCRLIGESVRNNNIRNLTNLILRKFKRDLDDEKLNLLKKKTMKFKNELECDSFGDVKSDLAASLKNEIDFKTEEKYSQEISEMSAPETKTNPLDLSVCKPLVEANSAHTREEIACSLPLLEADNEPDNEPDNGCQPNPVSVNCLAEGHPPRQPATESTEPALHAGPGDRDPDGAREGSPGTPPGWGDGPPATPHSDDEPSPPSHEELSWAAVGSGSIFDVPGAPPGTPCLKTEHAGLDCEVGFDDVIEREATSKGVPSSNEADGLEVKRRSSEEEELYEILREMCGGRLPSPVRDISDSSVDASRERKGGSNLGRGWPGQKRRLAREESSCKSKKVRGEEESSSGSLLDSIMSAMSLQNEEFKSKGSAGVEKEQGAESAENEVRERTCRFWSLGTRTYSRKKKLESSGSSSSNSKENSSGLRQSPRQMQNRQKETEKAVMEEIKSFVSSPMLCKEDADGNVKHCLSVLSNQSEDVIARCIVAIVLENVDEVVETFERPAPPLTKTQHRLIVLLSVFRKFDPNSDKASTTILSTIVQKLFPDNFFWPDDSVEAASRFYAALCRARNDPKTLWRFCLQAMTDMRQRCPLLVFTVLKTWPDVLHEATMLKNNLLALTLVNVFLHMPKTEGLRNFNQGRKLIALKHLLINFYQFKVEHTMEDFAANVVDAVRRQEPGAGKSLALLCRCRGALWTMKHAMPALKATLSDWCDQKADDAVGNKVLSVMKQICPVLAQESADEAKVRDVVHCLSGILTSGKKSHASEVNIVQVLLELRRYPEARRVIREWVPKCPIEECLRSEIINASAENILRELRLNKRKETKSASVRKRLKKQSKKGKGKKQKGKKRKKNERAEAVGASS